MRIMLDTNVVSELRKSDRKIDPQVKRWAEHSITEDFYISAITIVETEVGILRMEARDAFQGRMLRRWFEKTLLERFADRILPLDTEAALVAARFHYPDPAPQMDALIGATALVNKCTVATRNAKDYERFGVKVINPWEYES